MIALFRSEPIDVNDGKKAYKQQRLVARAKPSIQYFIYNQLGSLGAVFVEMRKM